MDLATWVLVGGVAGVPGAPGPQRPGRASRLATYGCLVNSTQDAMRVARDSIM